MTLLQGCLHNVPESPDTTAIVLMTICFCVRIPENSKYIDKVMSLDSSTQADLQEVIQQSMRVYFDLDDTLLSEDELNSSY